MRGRKSMATDCTLELLEKTQSGLRPADELCDAMEFIALDKLFGGVELNGSRRCCFDVAVFLCEKDNLR